MHFDLLDQANSASVSHAQAATPLSAARREAIFSFEIGVSTTQVYDLSAGWLTSQGARGGPVDASQIPFYFGINDVLAGDYRSHAAFNANAMAPFNAWANPIAGPAEDWERVEARRSVARGQALFNSKPIMITGVGGLNDDLHIGVIGGTCTTCHDSPNVGNHSVPAPLNIGLADASRRTPDLPLYTLRNMTIGDTVQTSGPGRALITGKQADIGRFKGPILRRLPTRAPYFHNGFAKDLQAVVDFYDTRFGIGFTPAEKADLVAFLRSL
jgi:cytochrome c peroxidase